jgi:hypothetical protein
MKSDLNFNEMLKILSEKLGEKQRTRGLWFKASPRKKLVRTHPNKYSRHCDAFCNPSYIGGIGIKIAVPA